MKQLKSLIKSLGANVIRTPLNYSVSSPLQGIIFLNEQVHIKDNFIYIGQPDVVFNFIMNTNINTSITIFIPEQTEYEFSAFSSCHNLIETKMDILSLYNALNAQIYNGNIVSTTLLHALCEDSSIEHILKASVQLIKRSIIILDSNNNVIGSECIPNVSNAFYSAIIRDGILNTQKSNAFLTMYDLHAQHDNCKIYKHHQDDHFIHYLEGYNHHNDLQMILLIFSDKNVHNIDMCYFINKLANVLLQTRDILQKTPATEKNLTNAFLADLAECKISSRSAIEQRLYALQYKPSEYLCVIVIQFRSDQFHDQFNNRLNALKDIFPGDNIGVYKNDFVILHSQNDRNENQLDLSSALFESFLSEHSAYAGISNVSRDWSTVRTLFNIARDCIKLGLVFRSPDPNVHLFKHEDYIPHYIIDLAATRFIEQQQHSDIIFMAHPSVIKIYRYDVKYKSNLLNVLYEYILNDRSITQTAKKLYLHRNTIQNKLNKVYQLTNIDIKNGAQQFRILMSCIIIKYYEDLMNNTID